MADRRSNSPWWLRRADQVAVAALVLAGLASCVAWWVARGGMSGQVVDIERAPPAALQFQVDVNTAEWPELAQLPGIGETLARRIVASRETEGPFVDHNDLRRVRGIGPRTLTRLEPYLLPIPETATVAGR